jgi:hypothetical protein
MIHHERSSSAPGNWRDGPFGDAMTSCVEWPSVDASPESARTQWAAVFPTQDTRAIAPYNPTRPLSPIFSPVEGTTPTTAVHVSPRSPVSPPDLPPKVPPKQNSNELVLPARKQSLTSKASRPWLRSSPSKSSLKPGMETLSLATSPPNSATSSPVRKDGRSSPIKEKLPAPSKEKLSTSSREKPLVISKEKPLTPSKDKPQTPSKEKSSNEAESLLMNRSHPVKNSLRRQKSQPAMFKPNQTEIFKPSEIDFDMPKMPTGLRPMEAVLVLPESEKAMLRKQAAGQAEQFEVLGTKHVNQLSRVCFTITSFTRPGLTMSRNFEPSTSVAITSVGRTNLSELGDRSFTHV